MRAYTSMSARLSIGRYLAFYNDPMPRQRLGVGFKPSATRYNPSLLSHNKGRDP
jgi:hypothetical protein